MKGKLEKGKIYIFLKFNKTDWVESFDGFNI